MPNFCLPPDQADKFKRGLISGEIDPVKLAEMTSDERHAFFAERFGDNAAGEMNRLLESKLLLKNQQQGMINWAQRVMASDKPAQRDVVSRIQNMKELLSPKQEDAFLGELASYRLGTRVSYDEAKAIADLSAKVDETRAARDAGGDRMAYGRAVVALRNFVGDLMKEANNLTLAEAKQHPVQAAGKVLKAIAGNSKAINASLDNSALFRQGHRTLFTHPEIWFKNAKQSFSDIVKAFGSDQVMNEVNADVISRPTYPDMVRAKLDVGAGEEMFPTSLPEHIPGFGRAYRASEHAFAAFQRRTRADLFDKYLQIAKDAGVDLDTSELQSIGQMVNSLTGRGNLGKMERVAGTLNNVFFSPRMVKSQIDTLLQPATGAGGSNFVRKQAAINLLKIIGGVGVILAIAKAIKKDSVEMDPRSSDFGKIKVGNTRFDVTGGMGSLATLAAREITGASKSSTSGRVTDLTSPTYGGQNREDVVKNYVENKFSPVAGVARDLLRGYTFDKKKPTVANEAANLFVPLPAKTFVELRNDPKSANIIAGMIADSLGVSVNDYGPK